MQKDWQYYLLNDSGESYTTLNDDVVTSVIPTPLENTPDGWQDLSIAWERNTTKWGVFRNFSLSLAFVLASSKILRSIFYAEDYEKIIYLLITKLQLDLTNSTYNFLYSDYYKGELDLTSFKDETDRVTVNIAEGGTAKLLKASEATVYEFDLDTDPEAVSVKLDGIFLQQSHTWLVPETNVLSTGNLMPGAYHLSSEGSAAGFAYFDETSEIYWPADLKGSLNYFFLTTQAIQNLTLSGEMKVAGANKYKVFLKSSLGQSILLGSYDGSSADIKVVPVAANFSASANEKFFLMVANNKLTGTHHYESKISVKFESKYRATACKGLPAWVLFKRLVGKITGNESLAVSALLQSKLNLVCTGGDAVRGLAGTKIKTSLNQFFDSFKSILGAGMGVEKENIVFERYEYFLNPQNPILLGRVKNFSKSLATDLLGNTVKIGYNTQSTDNVNGKYAFNNTSLFTSPIKRIAKELSFVSPYYSDPYAIELLRINLEGKTTTDNSNDNSVYILNVEPNPATFAAKVVAYAAPLKGFFVEGLSPVTMGLEAGGGFLLNSTLNRGPFTISSIQVVGGGFNIFTLEPTVAESANVIFLYPQTLKRVSYDVIEGVPSPATVFNIEELTPKRMMLAQQRMMDSLFYKFSGEDLVFQTTEKNADLATTKNGVTIDEDAAFTIGNNPLFLPVYFDFDTEVPAELVSLLATNQNRPFSIEDEDGQIYTGFLIKAAIAPNTRQEQSYRLLATPLNDLSKLIK